MQSSTSETGTERAALRGTLDRGWLLIRRAVPAFFDDRCPQLAAGIAFFALLSLFPLAIVLTAGFGLVVSDEAARGDVVDFVVERLPLTDTGTADLRSALQEVTASAGAVGIVGLALLVYSASALMGAVRNSLNAVWDIDDARPPVRGKLVDIALVFGLGSLFALSLAIALLGGVASDVGADIGIPATLLDGALSFVSLLLPIALAAAVFTICLTVVPAKRQRLRDVWPGIVIATAGYKLVQVGFSLYIENFGRYSTIYGSLGAVIAFMAFAFVAAMAFLLGAESASVWPRVRGMRHSDEPSEPLRQRILGALRGLVFRR